MFFWVLRGFPCDFKSNNLLLIGFIVILHGFLSKTSIFTTFKNIILSNLWLVVQVERSTKVLWVWASVSSGAGVGGRVGAGVGVWVWTAPVLHVPCAFFSL